MSKPRLFVGSSVEGLEVAYAIQENLKFVAETTVWDQGVFNLSETSLESLLAILETCDFGVFVFSPDDHIKIRGKKDLVVRDNVLFELGLFVGKLGKKRSFIVIPDNKEFHLPTDLIGMSPAKYEGNRSDNNMQAATGSASHKIREAINKLGTLHINIEAPETSSNISENKAEVQNDWTDYLFVKKDYDKAIEILKKKVRYGKDIVEKIYHKGWICYAEYQKDSKNGIIEYEKLISENSSLNTAYLAYINNLIWTNSFKKGIEVCDIALSKCEKKITITDLKAKCLWSLNQKEEANALLNSSLNSLNEPLLFLSLSDNYIELNDNKGAFELLQRAYFEFPSNEDILYKFAKTSYDVNQKEICVFLYKELITKKPNNATYWCLLGNAYNDLQLENLALSSYEKASEIAKDKEDWIIANIGNLYNNRNLYDKAEASLKNALLLNDKSEYTLNRLSLVYKSKQDEEKKVNEIISLAKTRINSKVEIV